MEDLKNLKRSLDRAGLRILPLLLFFAAHSRVFADVAWDPDSPYTPVRRPITSYFTTGQLVLICLLCIIVPFWLYAKAQMLKCFGKSGWEVLIPFLGRYLEYKYYWKAGYYWISFFAMAFSFVFATRFFNKVTVRSILIYAGLAVWAVNTVIMRLKTLETFGQKKRLVLLEFPGLGFVLDCICALSCRKKDAQGEPEDKQAPRQEETDNRE